MISGVNHLTLAVADLARSFDFYTAVLGCEPVARWDKGAYLAAGDLWLALIAGPVDPARPAGDYTHLAFSCTAAGFAALRDRLAEAGAPDWSPNTSEGASVYFLDPDGHKLEIHVGDLNSRLAAMRETPWAEIEFFARPSSRRRDANDADE